MDVSLEARVSLPWMPDWACSCVVPIVLEGWAPGEETSLSRPFYTCQD